MERLNSFIRKILNGQSSGRRQSRRLYIMAAVVLLITAYVLILPAVSLEKERAETMGGIYLAENEVRMLHCEKVAHHHTEECYQELEGGEKVLICGKSELLAHVHEESCYAYDEDGVRYLACTLEELEPHIHTEECYTTERALICTEEEREGHTHSEACYDADGNLTCTIPEDPGHVHTEECYGNVKVLICTKPELHRHTLACCEEAPEGQTPETMGWAYRDETGNYVIDPAHLIFGQEELVQHQHGDTCFETIVVETEPEENESISPETEIPVSADMAEPENGEATEAALTESGDAAVPAEEGNQEGGDAALPAEEGNSEGGDTAVPGAESEDETGMVFAQGVEIPREDGLISDHPAMSFEAATAYVAVSVRAPEGALPTGTVMRLKDVVDESVINTITSAVEGEVQYVHAVDITFLDAEGNEIQPLIPIQVNMTSLEHETSDNPVIVHVDDAGTPEIIEPLSEETAAESAP